MTEAHRKSHPRFYQNYDYMDEYISPEQAKEMFDVEDYNHWREKKVGYSIIYPPNTVLEPEPPGRKKILIDGAIVFDNRTKAQMDADWDKRMKQWALENPEENARIDKRFDNRTKYEERGVFYEPVNKDYLHQQSYQQRLAKAEQLNGCKFKDSPPLNSKRWQKMSNVLKREDNNQSLGNLCDGKTCVLGRLNGFTMLTLMVGFLGFLFSFLHAFDEPIFFLVALGFIGLGLCYQFVLPFDRFVFDRHTG
ncbi:hypothetical protein [Thalassotalea ganghwensis]